MDSNQNKTHKNQNENNDIHYSDNILFEFKNRNEKNLQDFRRHSKKNNQSLVGERNSILLRRNSYFIENLQKYDDGILKDDLIIKNINQRKTSKINTFTISLYKNEAEKGQSKKIKNEQKNKLQQKVNVDDKRKMIIINNKLERLSYADYNNKIKVSFLISNHLIGKKNRVNSQNFNEKDLKNQKTKILELNEEADEELLRDNALTGFLGKNLIKNVCQALNVTKETRNVLNENKQVMLKNSAKNLIKINNDKARKDGKEIEKERKVKLKYIDKNFYKGDEFTDGNDQSKNKLTCYKVKYFDESNSNFLKKKRYLKKIKKLSDSSGEEISTLMIKSNFVISHSSLFKKIWDFLIFIFSIYSGFFIPYFLSFPINESDYQIKFQAYLEVFFMIDIILNCFTSYYDHEENLIENIFLIIPNYIKNSFLSDLLSSLPVNLFYLKLGEDIILFTQYNCRFNLRCLRWLTLTRLRKISSEQSSGRYFEWIINIFNTKFSRLYKLIFYFFSAVHLTTCFFIFIGRSCIGIKNWLSIIGREIDTYEIYISSFYYNIVTIYTVGYGDIIPVNIVEVSYVCFFMVLSNFLYSYAISSLSYIFSKKNKNYTTFKEKTNVLNAINLEFKIPNSLFKILKQDLKNQFLKNRIERYEFLESLPSGLKNELIIIIYKNSIKHQSYFRDQSYEFVFFVLPLLKSQNAKKGDKLYNIREYIEEMYLVTSGILSLTLGEYFDNLEIGIIKNNEHFGDLFLQLNGQSPYELVCRSQSAELLVLKKTDYLKVKDSFLESTQNILEKSYKFLEVLDLRRNTFIKIFNLWNSSKLVKKKILQLNVFLMDKGFANFYQFGENFLEAHDYLKKLEENQIIELYNEIDKIPEKCLKKQKKSLQKLTKSLNENSSNVNLIPILKSDKLEQLHGNQKIYQNSISPKSNHFESVRTLIRSDINDNGEREKSPILENCKNKVEKLSIKQSFQEKSPQRRTIILESKSKFKKLSIQENLNSKNVNQKSKKFKKEFEILNKKLGDGTKKQDFLDREAVINNKAQKLLNAQQSQIITNNSQDVLKLKNNRETRYSQNNSSLKIDHYFLEIPSLNPFQNRKINDFFKVQNYSFEILIDKTHVNSDTQIDDLEQINQDLIKESSYFELFSNPLKKLINNEYNKIKITLKNTDESLIKNYMIKNEQILNENKPDALFFISKQEIEKIIDFKLEKIFILLKNQVNFK